ncbi:MAG: NADP-dependent oxidoreductase [bacterium]|nr:NADP-dependent oxidoreductase [bacterium]
MQAVQIKHYGSDDALELVEVERPNPAAGQVLVKVHAAGVNYYDIKIREGWLSSFFPLNFPHTLGNDFAGEVVEVGEGVTDFKVGDKVYGLITVMHGGTYAQYLAVDAGIVRKMPANIRYTDAASLPMAGLSGLIVVRNLAELQKDQTLLYHGGAGGVGVMSIQMAKHIGAKVIATASAENHEYVRSLGADEVIDYKTQDFSTLCKDVDAAVDPIGGDTNLRTFSVMRRGGRIVVVLRNDPVEFQNRERLCQEHGVEVKVLAFDVYPEGLDTLRDLVEAGHVKPQVKHVFSLREAQKAHQLIQARHFAGRIVLEVEH